MTKRVYVSDVHISSADAVKPATGQPYGWLGERGSQRLADFLSSNIVKESDQVFIVGDFVDMWTCPVGRKPPSFAEIMGAPHNAPIVRAVRDLRDAGTEIVYLLGNHDMQADVDEVADILGTNPLRQPFSDGKLYVEHGHERCLFNAPDPRPDTLPFGYFITRMSATAVSRHKSPLELDLWTILGSPREIFDLVTGATTLGQAVFDVCANRTGVSLDEQIIMPDGSAIAVRKVRDMFADCYERWGKAGRNNAAEAVACEWDPFYGFPEQPERVIVAGHSHKRIFSYRPDDQVLYLNLGSWCTNEADYAKTWSDDEGLWGGLFEWTATGERYINKAGVAP